MSTKKPPKAKGRGKKGGAPARKKLLSDDGPIVPRPAFRAFALEDECYGRRRMRNIGKCMEHTPFAPNATGEMMALYCDAIGKPRVLFEVCHNRAGKIVYRGKHIHVTPEQAVRDIFAIAKNATSYLSALLEERPALCQRLAANQSEWPVMADMTEKEWQRQVAKTVANLELGKDIKGYLLAARTADVNVIRCWATAIYETLFQTRFDYKEAAERPNEYTTTEGCPEWARKTLDLPRFTKADARKWAKLGEEMLLQQQPDFLDSPDLVAKKRSWTHRAQKDSRSGKASLRAIQREAFEDFAKELKNIAPERYPWRRE